MSDAAIPFGLLSADQFLESRPLTHRVELADGVIYNMSGGTVQHNQIAMNAVLALGFAARNLGCLLVSNDVELKVGPSTIYYPDVMAVCDVRDDDKLSRTIRVSFSKWCLRPRLAWTIGKSESLIRQSRQCGII
jgi:Uma2 family endonuclease